MIPTVKTEPYKVQHKVRIVTAASLFDGHDAAINIMRRIMQSTGVEVIHLGHNRSVKEIVDCAIQEDAQAIAITSYQGGHIEFFKYIYDLLKERGCDHIKLFGGGGGTILPSEIKELHNYGISRIYHPDDGRAMGLQGMINDLIQGADVPTGKDIGNDIKELRAKNHKTIGQFISAAENYPDQHKETLEHVEAEASKLSVPIVGITGTGGAGKSSMVDELLRRFLLDFPEKHIAVVSVDPSRRKTGGALLGDRIRMNTLANSRTYMRSMATREANVSISKNISQAINVLKVAGFDLIILETSGIGQSGTEIVDHSDVYMYVMTPEYGAASQLEKIDMLDFADLVAINKFDKKGAQDARRDVQKQMRRNHQLWDTKDEDIPVYGTIASQFNDPGTNRLYLATLEAVQRKTSATFNSSHPFKITDSEKVYIIPPKRVRYLSEIVENNRRYDQWVDEQCAIAQLLYGLDLAKQSIIDENALEQINLKFESLKGTLDASNWNILEGWENKVSAYKADIFTYQVRGRTIEVPTHTESLSRNKIPRVTLPRYKAWGDILRWNLSENVPGEFPYAAGVFPFKRKGEDPTRMFAGEGGPERTNKTLSLPVFRTCPPIVCQPLLIR